MMATHEKRIGYVGFSAQRLEMLRNGWLQARYYSDADSTRVKDFLSYDDVYEVNPFEVTSRLPAPVREDTDPDCSEAKIAEGRTVHLRELPKGAARKAYKDLLQEVVALLDLKDLLPQAFVSLSNGETRRVMLARELLKAPDVLEMDDPYNGLDPEQCAKLTAIIAALRTRGVEVVVRGDMVAESVPARQECRAPVAWFARREGLADNGDATLLSRRKRFGSKPERAKVSRTRSVAPAVVSFNDITVKYGRRTLYKHFSWTIREGERWVLRGRNGSGKTTLMALITGDSPLAYGLDVAVFGKNRDIGCDLHAMRKKIAMVSPEMQAYLGQDPETLLAAALKKKPKLLILDEPCMNLGLKAAKKLCATVAAYLKKNPKMTAICIAHRPEHVPAGFDQELNLDTRKES